MTSELAFLGGEQLILRELGFRSWLDVKQFAMSGFDVPPDDLRVLTLLRGHERYDDHYAGEWVPDRAGLHGPYLLSAYGVESFRASEVDDARAEVLLWLGRQDAPSVPLTEEVWKLVLRCIPDGATIFELPDLGEGAWHDWGSVVGMSTGFHEFVAISPDRARVTLLVASDD